MFQGKSRGKPQYMSTKNRSINEIHIDEIRIWPCIDKP